MTAVRLHLTALGVRGWRTRRPPQRSLLVAGTDLRSEWHRGTRDSLRGRGGPRIRHDLPGSSQVRGEVQRSITRREVRTHQKWRFRVSAIPSFECLHGPHWATNSRGPIGSNVTDADHRVTEVKAPSRGTDGREALPAHQADRLGCAPTRRPPGNRSPRDVQAGPHRRVHARRTPRERPATATRPRFQRTRSRLRSR